MTTCEHPTVTKDEIASHYNWATPLYRLLWGQHIHHGLWEDGKENLSPKQAQVELVKKMISVAGIKDHSHVLDVGCGMGGSSLYLAKHHRCYCYGVTLSDMQRRWAVWSARWQGLGDSTHFDVFDIESGSVDKFPFHPPWDVVWSVECTEHLFDKPEFFQRMANALLPGGKVVICAWLRSEGSYCSYYSDQARLVQEVCDGFLCPSLGSASDYCRWMEEAGLTVKTCEDLTLKVMRTWEICERRVRRSGVRWLAPLAGKSMVLFLERFGTILEAYRTGAMGYGLFVAEKV